MLFSLIHEKSKSEQSASGTIVSPDLFHNESEKKEEKISPAKHLSRTKESIFAKPQTTSYCYKDSSISSMEISFKEEEIRTALVAFSSRCFT